MITDFIWDFDGMLFDTYPHTTAALCEYHRRHNIIIDEKTAFERLKISIREAFRYFGVSDEGVREFYEIENDLGFAPHGVPYESVPEMLSFIHENGGRNYLYTHRDNVAVQYLEIYDLKKYFTDFVTREMDFPFKPSPDAVNYLIDKHSLQKESCLMLGDRPIDCGSGLNAGIKALLFDEFGNLSDSECSFYCKSIREVFETVKKLIY